MTLEFICLLFPTVSDPDILTWINQYSLSYKDCWNTLQQEQGEIVNIMCLGKPLNVVTDVKVSLPLSPGNIIGVP
jgi:hypothetical protein